MAESRRSDVVWRSRCDHGACVEVAFEDGAVLVRGTAQPETVLTLTPEQWRELLEAIKKDRLNR